jgi:hypothetical protein
MRGKGRVASCAGVQGVERGGVAGRSSGEGRTRGGPLCGCTLVAWRGEQPCRPSLLLRSRCPAPRHRPRASTATASLRAALPCRTSGAWRCSAGVRSPALGPARERCCRCVGAVAGRRWGVTSAACKSWRPVGQADTASQPASQAGCCSTRYGWHSTACTCDSAASQALEVMYAKYAPAAPGGDTFNTTA